MKFVVMLSCLFLGSFIVHADDCRGDFEKFFIKKLCLNGGFATKLKEQKNFDLKENWAKLKTNIKSPSYRQHINPYRERNLLFRYGGIEQVRSYNDFDKYIYTGLYYSYKLNKLEAFKEFLKESSDFIRHLWAQHLSKLESFKFVKAFVDQRLVADELIFSFSNKKMLYYLQKKGLKLKGSYSHFQYLPLLSPAAYKEKLEILLEKGLKIDRPFFIEKPQVGIVRREGFITLPYFRNNGQALNLEMGKALIQRQFFDQFKIWLRLSKKKTAPYFEYFLSRCGKFSELQNDFPEVKYDKPLSAKYKSPRQIYKEKICVIESLEMSSLKEVLPQFDLRDEKTQKKICRFLKGREIEEKILSLSFNDANFLYKYLEKFVKNHVYLNSCGFLYKDKQRVDEKLDFKRLSYSNFKKREKDFRKALSLPVGFQGKRREYFTGFLDVDFNSLSFSVSKNFKSYSYLIKHLNSKVVIGLSNEIIYLNKEKNKSVRIKNLTSRLHDVFLDNQYIYASLDKEIAIYDYSGKKVVEFKNPVEKAAHKIGVRDGIIYALDNIVYPIFIFKVNIKNIRSPRISEPVLIMGVNYHLDDHWLDSNGKWVIRSHYAHMGGSGQEIITNEGSQSQPLEQYLNAKGDFWMKRNLPGGKFIAQISDRYDTRDKKRFIIGQLLKGSQQNGAYKTISTFEMKSHRDVSDAGLVGDILILREERGITLFPIDSPQLKVFVYNKNAKQHVRTMAFPSFFDSLEK